MTDHVSRKHEAETIESRQAIRDAIEAAALDDVEREILRMRHLEYRNLGAIAGLLGYSQSQVSRKYTRALTKMIACAKRGAEKPEK